MGDIVLLVNRGLCNNLGDQAINNSFKAFLESNFSSEVFFADYTSTSKLVEPINCKEHRPERAIFKKILPLNMIWFFRNFYRVFTAINKVNPNLVVIGGGQLLLSNRFSIAAFTWVFFAKLLGVRVVFSNVGAGRSFSYFNKYLVKYALKRSDGINLRDPRSKFF
ncbi:polysaccharide pyruvyl transferase family protein [Pseudoalteromonas piscicida]|uniref:polysaccharide pyruvyl transferase family protein n=1 Tax=Pseudoalteromonas piscicida TaxID=43662 RepID=UPI000E35DD6F|nr:polysaccharide pyruvyl transferase family protein [Pseudoalteromonas piscicida]AXQ99040.1 polysaccharide pyruvyl transferase family protein [Pseudoalteromonas piscicida]